jgi:hypothetical protein
VIYYAQNLYLKKEDKPSLMEKLRNSGIHPTIRKPPKSSDLKGKDQNNNKI